MRADVVEGDMVADNVSPSQAPSPARHAGLLLAWYDRHRRRLPWRALPGEAADPYRVWLSEVMLQQTTVQAVKPYFEAFTQAFPTVADLAESPTEDVMRLWAGLGYYSRARNLHACAKVVVADHGGRFPADEASLLKLPGVGAYTAAAIASIAFGRRAVVVDGNVERVVARLHALETPLPAARSAIRRLADALTPAERPGDYAQAMMDLGATVCTPRSPACGVCPLMEGCTARIGGAPATYPLKAARTAKALRRGTTFVAIRADGAVLVRTRAPSGLLGGMTETPSTTWVAGAPPAADPPLAATWRLAGSVSHVFTHFPLELEVWTARLPAAAPTPSGMRWVAAEAIAREAFPTLFRKVLERAEV
jgi:A/G-specific adenine glycosylase